MLVLASPAYAWHFGAPSPSGPDGRGPNYERERVDPQQQRRSERQQLRDELRQRQRQGLSPAGGFERDNDNDSRSRRMSPEERRRFRREIDDAGRQVYGPRR